MRLGLEMCPCYIVEIVPMAISVCAVSCRWLRPRLSVVLETMYASPRLGKSA